jgi:hypothetical protein
LAWDQTPHAAARIADVEHLRLVLKSAALWLFIVVVIYFILNRP